MGSPLGPLLANVFVGFLEQQLFDKVHKLYCYVCYVDDTFTCFSSHNEELKSFSLSEWTSAFLNFHYGGGNQQSCVL